jgi:hypothetical protein
MAATGVPVGDAASEVVAGDAAGLPGVPGVVVESLLEPHATVTVVTVMRSANLVLMIPHPRGPKRLPTIVLSWLSVKG